MCNAPAKLTYWLWTVALFAATIVSAEDGPRGTPAKDDRPPNIVIIFIDDMGYADIGPFGAMAYATPHLDRMAAEGRKFTDFHVAAAVCSASRAALLTGCYPERVSILGALSPRERHGIHTEELTLAELCRQQGYATAIFGKWHLGHHEEFLPLQHGFDEYFGLPYSNDMWPYHPTMEFPELPLIEGNRVVNAQVSSDDQEQLTTWFTKRAVRFIERNHARPFFLYVPHAMVHVPLHVSAKFRGRSGAGLFGDVVMEIDWSVGQILDALARHEIDRQTLVIFTSDNGPWLSYGEHAGSAGPLREGKSTVFEGGTRVPCIMRWPERIPSGTSCDEMATTMDLLPTIGRFVGAELPADRVIDGQDIGPLVTGEPGALSPHEVIWCYSGGALHAVRDRRWKLHVPHPYTTLSGRPGGTGGKPALYDRAQTGLELYDLATDIAERNNVAAEHPDVVARLMTHVEAARGTLGDTLTNRRGDEVRAAGRLD